MQLPAAVLRSLDYQTWVADVKSRGPRDNRTTAATPADPSGSHAKPGGIITRFPSSHPVYAGALAAIFTEKQILSRLPYVAPIAWTKVKDQTLTPPQAWGYYLAPAGVRALDTVRAVNDQLTIAAGKAAEGAEDFLKGLTKPLWILGGVVVLGVVVYAATRGRRD